MPSLSLEETRTDIIKKPPGIETGPTDNVAVLIISPVEDDHITLHRILGHSQASGCAEAKWTIYPAVALEPALPVLRAYPVPIVLSESDLGPSTWKDVLAELSQLSDPPLLIVASRLADEYLWAEALNLGAYDVLAKPFEGEEVIRVLGSAWLHKRDNREIRNRTTMKMAAPG